MNKKQDDSKNGLIKYVRFTGMGVQMALTIWLGSLLGKWLDVKFNTNNEIYFKVVTLLTVFGSMFSFIRQVTRLSKDENS